MRHEIGFFARTNCERKKNVCGIRKKENLSTQRMKKYSNKKEVDDLFISCMNKKCVCNLSRTITFLCYLKGMKFLENLEKSFKT